jgi:hypothetical protein
MVSTLHVLKVVRPPASPPTRMSRRSGEIAPVVDRPTAIPPIAEPMMFTVNTAHGSPLRFA